MDVSHATSRAAFPRLRIVPQQEFKLRKSNTLRGAFGVAFRRLPRSAPTRLQVGLCRAKVNTVHLVLTTDHGIKLRAKPALERGSSSYRLLLSIERGRQDVRR